MKKLLLFGLVVGAFTLTSCKKDYTCTLEEGGVEVVVPYNDLSSSEAKDAKTACETANGVWK